MGVNINLYHYTDEVALTKSFNSASEILFCLRGLTPPIIAPQD